MCEERRSLSSEECLAIVIDNIENKFGGGIPDSWKSLAMKEAEVSYIVKGLERYTEKLRSNFKQGRLYNDNKDLFDTLEVAMREEAGEYKSIRLMIDTFGFLAPRLDKYYKESNPELMRYLWYCCYITQAIETDSWKVFDKYTEGDLLVFPFQKSWKEELPEYFSSALEWLSNRYNGIEFRDAVHAQYKITGGDKHEA